MKGAKRSGTPTGDQFLSPRELARALGVSESSLKRWCDQGLIETTRTAGGHRRLTLSAATEYLRRSGQRPVRPELLGLPVARREAGPADPQPVDEFVAALVAGDEERCRWIVIDLHLAGRPASWICDWVIAEALHRVGTGWECGDVQEYEERRGCGIATQILAELRSLVPAPKPGGPVAIGACPADDPYTLATTMVELVLRQNGWRAQSLGARLPFATLRAAIEKAQPQLFWLSVSHLDDSARFIAEYAEFQGSLPTELPVVVGGRALTEELRRQMKYTAFCDGLLHFEALAKALRPPASRASGRGGQKEPALYNGD